MFLERRQKTPETFSLNLPDEKKKVTKVYIFTPLCGTSKGFMKTVKEILGIVRAHK